MNNAGTRSVRVPLWGKDRLLTFAWQAALAVAIVAVVWLGLELVSRRAGTWPAITLSLSLFALSICGLLALRRR